MAKKAYVYNGSSWEELGTLSLAGEVAYVSATQTLTNKTLGPTVVSDLNADGTDLNLKTNGSTRLSIDSDGSVTLPYQPVFAGYRDAGSVTSGVYVANVAVTNRRSLYNTSTGSFFCAVAGAYAMHWQAIAYRDPGYGYCYIYKNGASTNMYGHWNLGAATWANPSVHGVVICAAGDTIDFRISTVSSNGGAFGFSHNSCAIYFLG